MELTGRPLLDTRIDAQLFVDRDDELAVLGRAVARRFNALVVGRHGSGKTSLLYRLRGRLRDEGRPAVLVDAATAIDAAAILDLVRSRIAEMPVAAGPRRGRKTAAGEDAVAARDHDHAEGNASLEAVRRLRALASERPAVVLLDGLPSATAGQTLFGRLRDELWQVRLTWVVAVDEGARAAVLTPPADAFFDVVVALAPLDERTAMRLLRARVGARGPDAELLRAVIGVSGGNPRTLLSNLRTALLLELSPADVSALRTDRDRKLAALGRPAAMLVAELEAGGPASASDEALLQRLGWTRARASQVLKTLEEAGLVTSTVRANGPGRPRKVYELTASPLAGTRGATGRTGSRGAGR